MNKQMGKIGKQYQKGLNSARQTLIPTYEAEQPIYKNWDTERANKYGLYASSVVYACIRRLSMSAASVPWRVEKRQANGRWKHVPDHPLELLLSHPNDFMTAQDMFERLTYHLNLGGNGIWHIVKVNNIPVELWPLQPQHITPVPHSTKYLAGYKYQVGGDAPINLDVDDLVHFQFVDPANPYWGLSPLQAVSKVVDSDVEAVNWNKVSLQRRGVPDGVFTVSAQGATRQQWLEARQQVRDQYLGKGREPWVVFNVDYKQMSLTPIEMDFLETRRLNREEICSVYGVLPILIGAMDKSSYNNIHTAKRIFWEDTIIPFLDDVASALDTSLLPYFEKSARVREGKQMVRVTYDISNVAALQDNLAKKAANAKLFFDMGVPIKQINERLELGFDDESLPDVARAPQGVGETGVDARTESTRGDGKKPPKDPDKNPNGKMAEIFQARMSEDGRLLAEAFSLGGKAAALKVLWERKEGWVRVLRGVSKALAANTGKGLDDPEKLAVKLCHAFAVKIASDFETSREVSLFYNLKCKDLATSFAIICLEGR